MTLRITKAMIADGWYKNAKAISKKCVNGGFVSMGKAHYQGQQIAKFYLSFTNTNGGYLQTYSKGEFSTLDSVMAAGNALARGEAIAA